MNQRASGETVKVEPTYISTDNARPCVICAKPTHLVREGLPRHQDCESQAPILYYWANNRRGAGVTGCVRANPVDFTRSAYRKGWRWLRVESEGIEVGGIFDHADTHKRSWWADDSDGQEPS